MVSAPVTLLFGKNFNSQVNTSDPGCVRYSAMSKTGFLLIRHFSRKKLIGMRTSSKPFPAPHKSQFHTTPQNAANTCQNLRITERYLSANRRDPKGLSHLITKLQENVNETFWKWGQCYQYRKFPARHWLVEQAVTSQLCLTMELLRTNSQSTFPLPEDLGSHQIEGTNCWSVQLYRMRGLFKRSSVSCVCPMCQVVHTCSCDWEGHFHYASQTSVLLLISPMKLRFLSSQQYACTEALVYNVSSVTPSALPQTTFREGWSWLEGLLAKETGGTRNPCISEPTP